MSSSIFSLRPSRFTLFIILLFAFALRVHHLTQIPPGLTHDEANHAREALGIRDGVFLFYFPLNYGSEPLYSYTVAGSMSLLGENLFAFRWVNVLFGLLTLSITYAWGRRALGRETAVLSIALMAVSFWPLASSREALRAGMLPFFMGGAVWFFWKLTADGRQQAAESGEKSSLGGQWLVVIGLAICVAATLHIYLAARVAWLLFPLFLVYLAMVHRPRFRQVWLPTLIGVAIGWLLAVPMFRYVQTHPEVSTRLDMLDRPLQELQAGNVTPLLKNAAEALLAFVWPGYGDQFLAYNIPGRPVFEVISAVFFVLGLLTCLYHWRKPPYAFLLFWFGAGILPSLVTGPTANTTRNLAAISAVYLLPAVGFFQLSRQLIKKSSRRGVEAQISQQQNSWPFVVIWLIFATWLTTRDYFVRWGESPEVRGAYQHTVVEMLNTVNEKTAESPLLISSIYPGPVHDPSLALLLAPEQAAALRWSDARLAMVFPGGQDGYAFIPHSTPPHPAFREWLQPLETITLRPDDLDPGFTFYQLRADWRTGQPVINFDGAVELVGVDWLQTAVQPGETAELLTIWRVLDPFRVGPIVPPIYTTDVVLFTHILKADGSILAQHDSLEAPSWNWQAGDVIVQVHPIVIPMETAAGVYETAVGLYDQQTGQRLVVLDAANQPTDHHAFVIPLLVR